MSPHGRLSRLATMHNETKTLDMKQHRPWLSTLNSRAVGWIDRLPEWLANSFAPLAIASVPLMIATLSMPHWLAAPIFSLTVLWLYWMGHAMTPRIFAASPLGVHSLFIMPCLIMVTVWALAVAYVSEVRTAVTTVGPISMLLIVIIMPTARKDLSRSTRRIPLAWIYGPLGLLAILFNTFQG